jgi:SET domain-containing protein
MLVVATQVRESAHGLGLFAQERVPAGGMVWRWDDVTEIVIPSDRQHPEAFMRFLQTYGYHAVGIGLVVNMDNARFMNHSDDPNCIERDGANYAVRDIEIGEELTCDYRVFDHGLAQCGAFLQAHAS